MATDDRRRRGESPRYDEELLRITAEYAEAARAGNASRISEYVRCYPQYARELAAYALAYSAVFADQPAPDDRPTAALSPAAQKALAYVREQRDKYETETSAAPAAAPASRPQAFDSLLQRGIAMGYAPSRLFAELGLSADLGVKLEAHVIAAASIPRTLVERLAGLLQTSAEAIQANLASTRTQAQGAQLYLAERSPAEYSQQSFLEAVAQSTLSEDEKRSWIEIARRDGVA